MSLSFSPLGTIVALATAPGRAGVAVVRLSGPDSVRAMDSVLAGQKRPLPRHAGLRTLFDKRTGEKIDQALVLSFPGPDSFTGEDVVEFQIHGGRAVVVALLDALCANEGVRPAEPGAFSRRAFENGKLDLTEAEGIADLVEAETVAQRRQALRQMEGELGRLYHGWAERLKTSLAYGEAEIDFADEEIPAGLAEKNRDNVRVLRQEIATHLADSHRGERVREGFVVALLGAPNAGKSSLLNALVRREVAIVAPTPGTTRDVIEVQLDLGGYPVILADTAGLRESADAVENEGIRRALSRAESADVKLLLFDGTKPRDEATSRLADDQTLSVWTKADLITEPKQGDETLSLSVRTGAGLDRLVMLLVNKIESLFAFSETPALTRHRHREALIESMTALDSALLTDQSELFAEDLRHAVYALGRITGHVDVEEILDQIFSTFCIGK